MKISSIRQKRAAGEICIICLLIIAALVALFAGIRGGGAVTFKPALIPLAITVDTKGNISLASSVASVPTPIGVFEFNFKGNSTLPVNPDQAFAGKRVLTVICGGKEFFYDMGDKSFNVNIPNDRHGKSEIRYDSATGNIFVRIPDPVWADN